MLQEPSFKISWQKPTLILSLKHIYRVYAITSLTYDYSSERLCQSFPPEQVWKLLPKFLLLHKKSNINYMVKFCSEQCSPSKISRGNSQNASFEVLEDAKCNFPSSILSLWKTYDNKGVKVKSGVNLKVSNTYRPAWVLAFFDISFLPSFLEMYEHFMYSSLEYCSIRFVLGINNLCKCFSIHAWIKFKKKMFIRKNNDIKGSPVPRAT